ncbi:DNA primase [Planomicrobium sp. YIM 101495]|uniref:DNA primase n=1 Tax=Planomicrobium sp. YIM 101495 TaxID=2665160 RepID=UPI0012B941A1|nr:DNA primase [Planomicrobium sp. YIM 101495]MTD31614.1 DNA primase [Planomicrobium sp. YIM 101495]
MSQQKWLKLGAATILSVGMLAACGGEDDQLEFEDPGADFEDGGDEGPAPEVNDEDGETDLDQNPDEGTDDEFEDDMEDKQDDTSDEN